MLNISNILCKYRIQREPLSPKAGQLCFPQEPTYPGSDSAAADRVALPLTKPVPISGLEKTNFTFGLETCQSGFRELFSGPREGERASQKEEERVRRNRNEVSKRDEDKASSVSSFSSNNNANGKTNKFP